MRPGAIRILNVIGRKVCWIAGTAGIYTDNRAVTGNTHVPPGYLVTLAEVMVDFDHVEIGGRSADRIAAEVIGASQVARTLVGQRIVIQDVQTHWIEFARRYDIVLKLLSDG